MFRFFKKAAELAPTALIVGGMSYVSSLNDKKREEQLLKDNPGATVKWRYVNTGVVGYFEPYVQKGEKASSGQSNPPRPK